MRGSGWEIDEGEVQNFLAEHLGPDVGSVELVGEGAWSRCFGFSHRDRDLVIRVGKFVEDFEKDRRAARFSSPALRSRGDRGGIPHGGFFAISSRAYGEPLESSPRRSGRR